MKEKSDICFIGLKCYDLLVKKPIPKYIGGIEKQLVSLARALAKKGNKVTFITYDDDAGIKEETIDGIRVIKSYDLEKGIKFIRFVYPRMIKLWQAMRKANAGIYMQMGAGNETGEVAIGAKYICGRRQFIFCVASDMDCEKELTQLNSWVEKWLYTIGLKKADTIFSQTRFQSALMHENFGHETQQVRMPIDVGGPIKSKIENGSVIRKNIIWIGRIVPVKRLEMFIDAARDLPMYSFHVVGTPNNEDEYYHKLITRSNKVANIKLHGRVDDDKLQELFLHASILCCTSTIEGFPTTFIESWYYGLPIVTTFDPDGIINEYNLGYVVDNFKQLKEKIEQLMSNDDDHERIEKAAISFYKENFSNDAIISKYQSIIDLNKSA